MRTERVSLTPAYMLHQQPWRETSRIVEVWSREYGRLGLVARGVRRPRSPYRSLLQPFLPLLVSWSQRSELGNLIGVEATGVRAELQGRPLMTAFYLNEILIRLLPRQDVHTGLYDRYVHTLGALRGLALSRAAAVRIFEKHLLAAAGYGLNLDRATPLDAPVRAEEQYVYDFDAGPRPLAGRHTTGHVFPGRALLALHHERLDDADDLREVRLLLHAALKKHLGGRPLKTSQVMRALAR